MARKIYLLFFLIYNPKPWLLASGCSECCIGYGVSDCQDWYDIGHTSSGVYHVTPLGTRFGYDVYCDMETDGGGWLVFQRRVDGSEDVYRNWKNYTHGFGNITREFWLGDSLATHNGRPFSTYDKENDMHDVYNCAEYLKGAWWFNKCMNAHLNGQYYCCGTTTSDGIVWKKWSRTGDGSDRFYSLRKSEMKIRRV